MDKKTVSAKWLAALLAVGMMAPAIAQYQWRDDAGHMFYSDKPPPSNIKPAQIIRAQPMVPVQRPADVATAPVKSTADRQMEDRKKNQDREEAARKQREDADKSARTAQACEALRGEQRALDSGMRIATIAPNGEREFMSDETREKKLAQIKRNISEVCDAG